MDEQKKYPESSAGAYKMVDIPLDDVGDAFYTLKSPVPLDKDDVAELKDVKGALDHEAHPNLTEAEIKILGTTERKITETEGVYVSEDKKLSEILKEKGLNVAEDQVTALVHSLFEFVEIVARKTENKFDDALIGFLPQLKEVVLEKVDEIDGKVG